ncbi:MAG: inositol oxygenase family protein [Rubripirellula sp.]
MQPDEQQPLESVDEWEDDLLRRYPNSAEDAGAKEKDQFRDYDAPEAAGVREFYRLNHRYQTFEFVQQKREQYLPLRRRQMGIWEALEFLNTLVDDSDPDTSLSQIEHLLQTAEAIRAEGLPSWFVLTGLIHDLGKVLCLYGEPQWAVVGDTFPVGCAFAKEVVLHQFFADNPDTNDPRFNTQLGVYEKNTGLGNVQMSWGHDEYLYQVVRDFLPEPALYMIRYHSFYAAHREGQYAYLMNENDQQMFEWVKQFNPFDLYTKSDESPNVDALRPYYEKLIAEFFPAELSW